MADELAGLRRARERTNPPVTIIVTNEVRTIVEKPVPAPAPPPIVHVVTNVQRVFVDRPVTNVQIQRVFITNTPPAAITGKQNAQPIANTNVSQAQVPAMASASTNQGVGPPSKPKYEPVPATTASTPSPLHGSSSLVGTATFPASPLKTDYGRPVTPSGIPGAPPAHTNDASLRTAALDKSPDPTRTNTVGKQTGATGSGEFDGTIQLPESASPMHRILPLVAIPIGVGVLIFLTLFFRMRTRAGEPFVLKLLVNGRVQEFDLEAGRDAVFLDAEVSCADKNSPHNCPRILITRKGAVLHVPKSGPYAVGDVHVNAAPVSEPRVLQDGDVLTLPRGNQPDQSIKFLGYAEAVPGVDEAEMQYAPANTTR